MRIYAPSYYKNFTCIADKCKHNCCIGWEIDIDDFTYERYMIIDGNLGEKLKDNICVLDNIPSFKLCENDRCPFLLENNLCQIIIERGEGYLSDICTDHPRYRNFLSDRVEIGLGLCCEEAARIILQENYDDAIEIVDKNEEETFDLTDDELYFLGLRRQIFEILNDNSMIVSKRFNKVLCLIKCKMPIFTNKELSKLYLSLERLDNSWTNVLENFSLASNSLNIVDNHPEMSTKLANYFIYRHLTGALDDGKLKERIMFSLLSTEVILRITEHRKNDFNSFDEALIETSRAYSSEIEYSDSNTETLFNIFC